MGMGLAPDLDPATAVLEKTAALLNHTTKPLILTCDSDAETFEDMIAMAAAAAGGQARLEQTPFFMLLVDPTSPLVHTADALEKILRMADHRLPIIYAPGIMAGATSPVTIAGAVSQACAEILAGLIVHQLSAPGAPFIFGGGMSPMDMKSGQPTYAAPEAMIAQAALCQMGRDYYRLPTFGFGGCSASKCFDAQAVNEAASFLMMSAWMGTNLVHDIGYIEFGMTYSVELMVFCNEIIGQIRRLMDGLGIIDSDSLALDAIRRVGPGGLFLADAHTLSHFRSNWMPDLTDRATRETWKKKGAMTMTDRIGAKIQDILQHHQTEPLADEALNKIKVIINKARLRNKC
jgi:trimethylamine--corrinoid protein Co-methyltransferase